METTLSTTEYIPQKSLPRDLFKSAYTKGFRPEHRLILKMLQGTTKDCLKTRSKYNTEQTETKLLTKVKDMVLNFIRALNEAEPNVPGRNLSFEVVHNLPTKNEDFNVEDKWSTDKEHYFIWLDSIFGLVLKENDKPIAVLGLDLDYDHSSQTPGKFSIQVSQNQGINARKKSKPKEMIRNNLRGLDITKIFFETLEAIRQELGILCLKVLPAQQTAFYLRAFAGVSDQETGEIDPEKKKEIEDRLHKRYDQAALDRGFKLNTETNTYVKNFTNSKNE